MFIIISNQIIKMFLLMLIGFVCFRTKLVDQHGNKALTNILLMTVTPCMIINAFQLDYKPELLQNVIIALILSILAHIIAILFSSFIIFKKNNLNYAIERFSIIYSNCAFMGIPLIYSILGDEGVLYIAAYTVAFNLLAWTHGLIQLSGNTSRKQIIKSLTSPIMIGILIGFLLFIFRIQLPDLIGDTVSSMASLTTPLSMIVAGISLAQTDLLQALKNKRLYFISFIRLIVVPIGLLAISFILPFNKHVLCTIIVAGACPAGSTGTMITLKYGGNYKYASEIFVFSTLLSLFTIPIIVILIEQMFL